MAKTIETTSFADCKGGRNSSRLLKREDKMPEWYERYQRGFHQEVYDELMALQGHIHDPEMYDEVLLVMQTLMRRVRSNIEQIIPRLQTMGYLFHKGGFRENALPEKQRSLEQAYPVFQPPMPETPQRVAVLEQLTGSLPLSLKCWYEEVGSVNLVGLFPSDERAYGPVLDPLWINPVEIALQQVTSLTKLDLWEEDPLLILAPDGYHKYGYSGAGSYNMALPCTTLDTALLDEPHHTTFVNYLRICLHWGGFPGLEQECRLSSEQLTYLTKDLLPF